MFGKILKLKQSWDFLKETKLPIVLYGTGNGADKVLDRLRKNGIAVSGVTASDGFVRNRFFRGFKVKPVSDFENEYEDFVVIIGFGTHLPEVIDNIIAISKRHKVLVPCVPVYGEEFFDADFIARHEVELLNALDCFYDERSKQIFLDVIRFELTGELEYLLRSETEKDEAFREILKLSNDEKYLDLGAYRGDTTDEFLRRTDGKYSQITALEPDKKSFSKLCENYGNFKNMTLINKAVGAKSGSTSFVGGKGKGSSEALSGGEVCETVSVDELCPESGFTYVKADVEGCEYEMLRGACNTLQGFKPKLNIAVYHRSEDIFKIPLKIKAINPEYKIFLRHHKYIPCWDLNVYCV